MASSTFLNFPVTLAILLDKLAKTPVQTVATLMTTVCSPPLPVVLLLFPTHPPPNLVRHHPDIWTVYDNMGKSQRQSPCLSPMIQRGLEWAYMYYAWMDRTCAYAVGMGKW